MVPALRPSSDRDGETFWRMLLAASVMAAAVSLLTTGAGLSRYVSLPMAWTLAVAVQLGLFGLAWLIGVGRRGHRLWISLLYCATMLFSVVFSYVTLQSELTEKVRPAESRRRLLDLGREALGETRGLTAEGVRQSEDLALRVGTWLRMEEASGWATRTCEAEEHCYLADLCGRIRAKIASWEQESGRTYREGPGRQLIYGTLAAELESLEALGARLRAYQGELAAGGGFFEAGLDNRERITHLDLLLDQAPAADLERVLCREAAPPEAPAYADHARDAASEDEQPVYAWSDLARILRSEAPLGREDYPTLFALALALFIDLFVLAVALGASLLGEGPADHSRLEETPDGWEASLQEQIATWIDASLLEVEPPGRERLEFLRSLLAGISFDGRGRPRLVPEDGAQSRFGQLLVQARAARVEGFVHFHRRGWLFVLEDWVYGALARHFAAVRSQGAEA